MISGLASASKQLLNWIGLNRESLLGKFGQDVLWNVASFAIMGMCGAGINIVIGRWYTPDVVGVFNQVYSIYVIVSQIAVAGIHLSVLKYVAEYSQNREIYRPSNTAAMILTIAFAVFSSSLLWMMRGQIGNLFGSPDVAVGISYIAFGLVFFSINKVLLAILNGLSRMKLFAVFQALRYILIVTTLLIIALLNSPGNSLNFAFTISELILLICMLPVIYPEFALSTFVLLREWIVRHLDFGMRGFLSNVLAQMYTRVDVLILGFFYSDHTVGIYSFAAIVAEGLYQLPVVLRTTYNPILVQLLSRHRLDELKARIRKGLRITYAMMSVITMSVVLLYPLGALVVKSKADYLHSWSVLVILAIGIVLSSGYIPFGYILLQAGRPGLQTIMTLTLFIINLLLNLLLAPIYGITGSAIATALAYILSIFILKAFAKVSLKVQI